MEALIDVIALSRPLQEIAEKYVQARGRIGAAVLETAEWLAQARRQSDYGEWYVFLSSTDTSPDMAAGLLNIARLASENSVFADAIRSNFLNQTTAMRLARPSTPPEVLDRFLSQDEPPAVRDIMQAIQSSRSNTGSNQDLGSWVLSNPATVPAHIAHPEYQPMAVHYSSATPEWYTPRNVIDRVVEFFDEIDLDPCSNSGETPNVPALHRFTERDNGLEQQWFGRVYMNPPYGDGIGNWTSKLAAHYEALEIEAAIALLPARTDTEWFSHLQNYAVCFIRGRLKFVGAENSAPFPSMLVYLGDEVARFTQVMAPMGRVWVAQPEVFV